MEWKFRMQNGEAVVSSHVSQKLQIALDDCLQSNYEPKIGTASGPRWFNHKQPFERNGKRPGTQTGLTIQREASLQKGPIHE